MKITDDRGYRAIQATVQNCKNSIKECKALRDKHRALLPDKEVERAARVYLENGSLRLIQNAGLSLCDVRLKILQAALRIQTENLKQFKKNWKAPDCG